MMIRENFINMANQSMIVSQRQETIQLDILDASIRKQPQPGDTLMFIQKKSSKYEAVGFPGYAIDNREAIQLESSGKRPICIIGKLCKGGSPL